LYNFYSACAAILGTITTLWIGERVSHLSIYVLPFAAGGFIYLAAASLLPEILKETSKRNYFWYILCILLGAFVMYYFSTIGGHQH
jgi:zinc and cadmium transporter